MLSTLVLTCSALAGSSYIGYLQYDSFQIFLGCFISPSLAQTMLVRVVCFLLFFHEGQVIVIWPRSLSFYLFHEAIVRIFIMRDLLKRRLSFINIQVFQEIRIVTRWLCLAESILVGVSLGATYLLVLFSVGTLYFGFKRNSVSIALPALMFAFILVGMIQSIFIFGCAFFNLSNSLLVKWKKDASMYKQRGMSKAEIQKVVKSLQVISVPAGSIGIIDRDITMNYMDNLLHNVVDLVLTLNDLLYAV